MKQGCQRPGQGRLCGSQWPLPLILAVSGGIWETLATRRPLPLAPMPSQGWDLGSSVFLCLWCQSPKSWCGKRHYREDSNRSLGIAPRLDKQLSGQGIYNSRQWTLKNLPCSRDQRQWPTATVAQSHNDPKPRCPIALLSDFCSLWLGGSWRLLWLCLTDIPAIGKKVILSSHPLARLKYLKCKVLKFQYQTNNTFHFPHNSWLTRTSAEKKMCAGAILTTTKPGRNSNNRKGQGGPERMGEKKKKGNEKHKWKPFKDGLYCVQMSSLVHGKWEIFEIIISNLDRRLVSLLFTFSFLYGVFSVLTRAAERSRSLSSQWHISFLKGRKVVHIQIAIHCK